MAEEQFADGYTEETVRCPNCKRETIELTYTKKGTVPVAKLKRMKRDGNQPDFEAIKIEHYDTTRDDYKITFDLIKCDYCGATWETEEALIEALKEEKP